MRISYTGVINMNEIKKYFRTMLLVKRIGFASALLIALLSSTPAHAIKKCQDADGKWHYGDVAVRACQNSKVTTLSDKGFVKAKKEAPKSEEQLEAQRVGLAEIEAERLRQEELESERSRILTVYESEADIDRQRESRLLSIDNNIAVHNSYIKSLKEHIDFDQRKIEKTTNVAIKGDIEAKIAESQQSINDSKKEISILKVKRKEVAKMFDNEKSVYRELTKSK